MEMYVKTFFKFYIFSFVLFSIMIFFIYIDFTHIAASNAATDDVTIRSHIEYLIQTYNILVLILYDKKCSRTK